MKHEDLKKKAIEAISAVHSDMSVSAHETLESLQEIAGELDDRIQAMKDDLRE